MSSWQTDAILATHAVMDEVLPPSSLSLADRARAIVARCKANADLLAACKGLLGQIRDDQRCAMRMAGIVSDQPTHDAIDAARAAIAKAKETA